MPRHITWELFYSDYIKPGVPAKYQLNGKPRMVFYVTENARKIGLKIYLNNKISIPEMYLKEISLDLKADKQGYYADFSTINSALFEHFYSMMCFISDAVQINQRSIADAVDDAVESLKSLISSEKLLSEEKVVGVWGELLILKKLICLYGINAVYSWKGAEKAIHDFRMNGLELEVKTTRNESRIHMISRLSQLDHSPEFDLFLCSIQVVESATDGVSLNELVGEINKIIGDNEKAKTLLKTLLANEGFKECQANHYVQRYYLRSRPEIVHVTDRVPKIVRSMIDNRYGEEFGSRIDNVNYSLDVTGLGEELTDEVFKRIIGKKL